MSREEAKPLGWQMKVASLRNVGRMFRLLWATSPPLLASTIVLHLSRATLPIFLLWIPKLIVDRLVAVLSHSRTDTSEIWKLLALEFALALLNDVLGRLITLADSLLGDRFTNQVSVRMMAHAASLDLASFEDPVFYDKLERARGQA